VCRVFAQVWNRTELNHWSKPWLLAGYRDPLLTPVQTIDTTQRSTYYNRSIGYILPLGFQKSIKNKNNDNLHILFVRFEFEQIQFFVFWFSAVLVCSHSISCVSPSGDYEHNRCWSGRAQFWANVPKIARYFHHWKNLSTWLRTHAVNGRCRLVH